MPVYAFHSIKDADVLGFTEDKTGSNLPPEFSPWTRQGAGQAMQTEVRPPAGADGGLITRAIRSQGYFLTRTNPAHTRPLRMPALYL